MLGDVGQPQLVGTSSAELALDQVLAGGCVLEVLVALLGPGQAFEAQLGHDPLHQLGIDNEPLLDLQGGLDPQDPVGASGTGVNIGDRVSQQEAADRAVSRPSELDLVVGRTTETDDLTGDAFGVAQVVQPSDNLELPFGSTVPSSKRALAALTNFSSASSSLTRRRAASSGSAS